MSFFTNESMLDIEQLREILGEDMVHVLKNQNRMNGDFPSDQTVWGYGKPASLINWNYEEAIGKAQRKSIEITQRCMQHFDWRLS